MQRMPDMPRNIVRLASCSFRQLFALETRSPFLGSPFCVTLARMGSKDKGRKEVKKAPKPKPKPEPSQRRETFTPAPPK
jgi:hypothetical protein